MDELFYEKLKTIVEEHQIIREEPLSKHCTFRIGGPAMFFVMTNDAEEIIKIQHLCRSESMPYFILGNGSNILPDDKGYRGVIIKLNTSKEAIQWKEFDGGKEVICEAGILLAALANEVAKHGLSGFEFASGIPGTLGGAIFMNAGAYDGEIRDFIVCADAILPDGTIKNFTKDELELSYRSSIFQKIDAIILNCTLKFYNGDSQEIIKKIEEYGAARKAKQPLELPSGGSTFKRPQGNYAGKLIMESGLRGYRVGGAMISEKHCNFVVNIDQATSADVKLLIQNVIQIVKEKTGFTLEPEIRFI